VFLRRLLTEAVRSMRVRGASIRWKILDVRHHSPVRRRRGLWLVCTPKKKKEKKNRRWSLNPSSPIDCRHALARIFTPAADIPPLR